MKLFEVISKDDKLYKATITIHNPTQNARMASWSLKDIRNALRNVGITGDDLEEITHPPDKLPARGNIPAKTFRYYTWIVHFSGTQDEVIAKRKKITDRLHLISGKKQMRLSFKATPMS